MIVLGDARRIPLKDSSVQCVVTSPPYWGLRDYGIDNQIGLEKSPAAFVDSLVGVFREIRRVLKSDGIAWLNIGDSYISANGTCHNPGGGASSLPSHQRLKNEHAYKLWRPNKSDAAKWGLKHKDLALIPARIALALQADGWWIRSDVIWSKSNSMPESVSDRPTRSHEYIFLLAKSERYYYDAKSIMEPATFDRLDRTPHQRGIGSRMNQDRDPSHSTEPKDRRDEGSRAPRRNKRSVWIVAGESSSESHCARFPRELIEPCILAGARPGDIVLDPFLGSGTVGQVCEKLGRRWVGIDLNPKNLKLATNKTAQIGMIFGGVAENA